MNELCNSVLIYYIHSMYAYFVAMMRGHAMTITGTIALKTLNTAIVLVVDIRVVWLVVILTRGRES